MGDRKLGKCRGFAPFPPGYILELDASPELCPVQAAYYQSQIGILRWIVELGHVDIIMELSLLSFHMALPQEGHLDTVFNVFSYLKANHNSRMAFDPMYPEIDMSSFKEHEWINFYGEVEEAVPPNAPEARGKEVDICLYVDSDYSNDRFT